MNPLSTNMIGKTGLQVSKLGLGGAPLGSLQTNETAKIAHDTVVTAHESGITYFDTAPLYGLGKSESYLGRALGTFSRDSFLISSKVGRVLDSTNKSRDSNSEVNSSVEAVFDFSRDGILRSLDESLKRLGLDRIDIVFIHDPDNHHRQAVFEALPALVELRSQGVISAIGAGMNQWQALFDFASEGDFDCFLLAGRYTLLDHSGLTKLLPLCQEQQISVMLGGPYNSGVLASDLQSDTTYFYQQTPPEVLTKAREIKSICDRYDVPLKAAALQFGLAHPAVAATIPGARSPQEVQENIQMVSHPIPVNLWEELKRENFLPENAPVPME